MKQFLYIVMAFILGSSLSNAQCNFIPVINAFTPLKGHVGDTIKIGGSGFGFPLTCITNVDVYFGATKATVINCSTSDTILVKVPAEATYAPITVINFCGNVAVSKLPFDVTFCPTIINSNSFNTVSYTQALSGGYQLLSLDFDKDGNADIINCGFMSNKISICLNNGSTPGIFNFSPPVELTLPGPTRCIVPADYNGDGKIDLAVVYDGDSSGILFYLNTSTPGFISVAYPFFTIQNVEAYQCAAGDFNNDGKMDIAFSEGNEIKTYKNNSTSAGISFTANTTIDNYGFATGIVVADINKDGKMDIATSCGLNNKITIIRNITSASSNAFSFVTPSSTTSSTNIQTGGEYPYRIIAGDFDKDGRIDLATNNYGDVCGVTTNCNVAIFRNTTSPLGGSNISFATPVNLISPSHNYRIGLADADGDGDVDIFTKSLCGNIFSIYVNKSSGIGNISFEQRIDYTGASEMSGIVIADFDNDRKPDYASSGILYNTLYIHRNLSIEKKPPCSYNETKYTCDSSYTWWLNQNSYTSTGSYVDSFLNECGCFCVGTLHLFLSQSPSSVVSVSANNTYVTAINSATYTTSGTYVVPMQSATGCSGNLTLNLSMPYSGGAPFSTSGCNDCDTAVLSTSKATDIDDEEIVRFVLNGEDAGPKYTGINACDTIGPSPNSILKCYSDFRSLGCLTTLTSGPIYTFSIQENECGNNINSFKAGIWIDYNHNGNFDTTEKVYSSTTSFLSPDTVNGTFSVPVDNGTTILPGLTCLRVIVARDDGNPINPNTTYSNGETEDYCVNLMNNIPTTTAVASSYSICGPANVTVSLAGNLSPVNANTYQWINECDTIYGATSATYSAYMNSTSNLYCIVSNAVTGATVVSSPASVVVNPQPALSIFAAGTTVCVGSPATLSVTGAVSYEWMPGALSGSSISVTPNSTTNYTVTGTSSQGCTSTTIETVIVTPCNSVVNLKLFIEGYYIGASLMIPVLANQGELSSPTACDSIDVLLRDINSPYNLIASTRTILNQDGTASCLFPAMNGQYYLVVSHRNGLETWSAIPVFVGSIPVVYDFTISSSQAYGNNLIEVENGIWAFYSGELNKDENIDLYDLLILETGINDFLTGYYATDLNGDGNVDLLDAPFMENNLNQFIYSNHP